MALINLQLPPQDPHKMKPINIPEWTVEGLMKSYLYLRAINNQWLLENEVSFLQGVALHKHHKCMYVSFWTAAQTCT